MRLSRKPGRRATLMQLGSENVCAMETRQVLSTALNILPSVGIWRMMSSEEKMGSRYSQVDCTFIQLSRMSCIDVSVSSHLVISVMKGLIKRDPFMAWVLTIWSSSSCWISSTLESMRVPDCLYSLVSKIISFHSASILSIAICKPYSFEAEMQMSSLALQWCCRPNSSIICIVYVSPLGMRTPVRVSISFQWRSFMPGLQMSSISGTLSVMNSFTSSCRLSAMRFATCLLSPILSKSFAALTRVR
mmetsp:Transcript_8250/g.18106  ORF Transcript_8250/g.18106 Transcript_8250/m.18106 type:complete len:246 (-) Transcript_8250:315-1052(-)